MTERTQLYLEYLWKKPHGTTFVKLDWTEDIIISKHSKKISILNQVISENRKIDTS